MDREWICWKRRPETIGHKLRQARTKAGLTQMEMSVRCAVSLRTYRAYETDNHQPSNLQGL
jgi:DNA-binding XRE family transcriptional regulator